MVLVVRLHKQNATTVHRIRREYVGVTGISNVKAQRDGLRFLVPYVHQPTTDTLVGLNYLAPGTLGPLLWSH